MKTTKKQLRKIIRESLLLESEMKSIIKSSYENVDDYNVLANYALTGDIAGALADPALRPYVEKNEMGFLADEAHSYFRNVGADDGGPPAPDGWDSDKAYQFLRAIEGAAWQEYDKMAKAAIAADPDREFLEFLGNHWTTMIEPNDMEDIKWKEYKRYIRLKPPSSISHGVGEITINKEDYEYDSGKPGTWDEFKEFLERRTGGQLGRRKPYKRSPAPYYD